MYDNACTVKYAHFSLLTCLTSRNIPSYYTVQFLAKQLKLRNISSETIRFLFPTDNITITQNLVDARSSNYAHT